ncbi:MAG: glycosyltransferase [Rhodoferax sp.]|nr:glycosyltransferase [Rhodoferax sp.]
MTNTRVQVSVCIANYNGMEVIDDCIRSIQDQQGDIHVEILVHDDASTDGSVAHIQERYPQVILIVSETNAGFCIANNRMAAQAKGQYLLLLNNDAALFTDALQSLLVEAGQIDKPAILTLPQYDATTGVLVDRGCLLDPFFNPVPNLDPNRTDVAMVIGACLWVPKALWDELGGFPEWFGSIAEDMYLCCRARLAGYAVRVPAVSGYSHWQGMSFGGGKIVDRQLSSTFRRRALSERNKTFVLVITCPQPILLLLLPIHVLLLLSEGILLSILQQRTKYLSYVYLPICFALFRNGGILKKERHRAMRQMQTSKSHFFAAFDTLPYKLSMLLRYGLPNLKD